MMVMTMMIYYDRYVYFVSSSIYCSSLQEYTNCNRYKYLFPKLHADQRALWCGLCIGMFSVLCYVSRNIFVQAWKVLSCLLRSKENTIPFVPITVSVSSIWCAHDVCYKKNYVLIPYIPGQVQQYVIRLYRNFRHIGYPFRASAAFLRGALAP